MINLMLYFYQPRCLFGHCTCVSAEQWILKCVSWPSDKGPVRGIFGNDKLHRTISPDFFFLVVKLVKEISP